MPDLWTLCDHTTPWCIHVASTLRIAEQIADGNTQIEGIAAAANCDTDALHRVLRYLVGKGVFLEPTPGTFALNDVAQQFLDPSSKLGLDLNGIGGRMAHAWSTLPSYVRTGAPAYFERFGLPFWEDLAAHPDVGASFDALIGPSGHGIPNSDFEITGGWDQVQTVVDVGGGTGAMLAEILRARPAVRGTLVDLPPTVARATATFQAAGVADRITVSGQSFFDPLPAGADLYLLRGILNDWPDREATAILTRCAEAAGAQGRVVVLKSVGPEVAPKNLSIETVLLGGRHRGIVEFQQLAGAAGLAVVAAGRQASGYFVVECRMAKTPAL